MFASARTCAERVVRSALDERSDLPLYGMLRYFMGYADELLHACDTVAGKRIRASLVLLTAEMCGGGASAKDLAVAIELFHNFTLMHDDIEDHDDMRRGRPTVWKLWGVNHAINAGDAQAFITSDFLLRVAMTGDAGARAACELNACFLEVIEGQYMDFELTVKRLTDTGVTIDTYLEMTRKKTSVLVGAATAGGGLAAGCDEATHDLLYTYGESLGMAYQIADDMASIWGEARDTGKRARGDLYERKKTYPVLYARDHGVNEWFMARYNDTAPLSDDDVRELLKALTATGACEATRALGASYVERAKVSANALPFSPAHKKVLTNLVDALVHFAPKQHATD